MVREDDVVLPSDAPQRREEDEEMIVPARVFPAAAFRRNVAPAAGPENARPGGKIRLLAAVGREKAHLVSGRGPCAGELREHAVAAGASKAEDGDQYFHARSKRLTNKASAARYRT